MILKRARLGGVMALVVGALTVTGFVSEADAASSLKAKPAKKKADKDEKKKGDAKDGADDKRDADSAADEKSSDDGDEKKAGDAEGGKNKKGDEDAEAAKGEKFHKVDLGLDMAFGFGATPALNPGVPVLIGEPSTRALQSTNVASDSYILGAGYWLSKTVRAGLRFPLVHGNLDARGTKFQRGEATIGNLELNISAKLGSSDKLRIVPELALLAPTARGDELPTPTDLIVSPSTSIDDDYDAYAVLRAAGAARGGEENALFATKRFGAVPKISIIMDSDKLRIAPWLKINNMIDVTGAMRDTYLAQAVAGVDGTYELTKGFAVMGRLWTNVAINLPDGEQRVIVFGEPRVVGTIDEVVDLYGGVLLPVFPFSVDQPADSRITPEFDPRFITLRVGTAVRF